MWNTPWTALQPDFAAGPVQNQVKGFLATGCSALMTDVAKPVSCLGRWNLPLTPIQLAGYKKLHDASLIVDYGWDKA